MQFHSTLEQPKDDQIDLPPNHNLATSGIFYCQHLLKSQGQLLSYHDITLHYTKNVITIATEVEWHCYCNRICLFVNVQKLKTIHKIFTKSAVYLWLSSQR